MKKFYVGVKAVIETDQGILVLKHQKGHYGMPGGRIDDNEDLEEALRRELHEELPGLKNIKIGKIVSSFRLNKEVGPNTGLILLHFLVQATLPEPIQISDEFTEYLFIKNLAEIPKGFNSEVEIVLRKIMS